MSAIAILQNVIEEQFDVRIGDTDANRLWMKCLHFLSVMECRETVASVSQRGTELAAEQREDIFQALSHALIHQDWPRQGVYGKDDVNVFACMMRDAMRRQGFRIKRVTPRQAQRPPLTREQKPRIRLVASV